jgi:hypothetical protein
MACEKMRSAIGVYRAKPDVIIEVYIALRVNT